MDCWNKLSSLFCNLTLSLIKCSNQLFTAQYIHEFTKVSLCCFFFSTSFGVLAIINLSLCFTNDYHFSIDSP